eukprot:TRINITY_DN10068_c0_g1_i1.p1 TRINITY_DN10068_c0_g1~~TRINITY_DN10068_c0_g1_i1.p1  ORF type:complete len:156 (-),score=12.82 TRINITY_DN10068_c0_g1_i1:62-529(-)
MMKSVSALGAALPALVVETCGAPVFERPLKVVHNATARTRGNAVLSAVHRLQQRIIAAYFTPMGLICTAIGLSLILIGVRVLWVALGCECVQPPWLVWLLQNANVARNSRLNRLRRVAAARARERREHNEQVELQAEQYLNLTTPRGGAGRLDRA